jgi:hypothetical protein
MKFYSIKDKRPVEVPDKEIKARKTANGRFQLVATHMGQKLYKFATEEVAKKYM